MLCIDKHTTTNRSQVRHVSYHNVCWSQPGTGAGIVGVDEGPLECVSTSIECRRIAAATAIPYLRCTLSSHLHFSIYLLLLLPEAWMQLCIRTSREVYLNAQ